MNDGNAYDPFAAPQAPSGNAQSGGPPVPATQPTAPPGPQPFPQSDVGYPPMMPAAPYGYGAPPPVNSGEKNYLGILALIFPFVSLALVGIIMGHLGLSAVKRGKANNRGVALAGTIVSWVFTVGTLALVAAAVPVYMSQRAKAEEAEVRADLASLNLAVATYSLERGVLPDVSIEGNHYLVGDSIEPKSYLVEDVDIVTTDGFSYCLAVTYHTDEVWSISDSRSMEPHGCPDAVSGDNAPVVEVDEPPAGVDQSPPPTGPADGVVQFTSLAVGDCIADPADNLVEDEEGQSWVSGATLVDCAAPHYGEVYAVAPMDSGAYVEDDIYAEADELCYVRYEYYVGTVYEDSAYYYEAYYPSATGWELGDRETTCVVTSYESDTVGSLQGSGL